MKRKKLLLVVLFLLLLVSALSAEASLLSYATNGLFKNQNDFVTSPCSEFNYSPYDIFFAQGDYGRMDVSAGKNGGGTMIGYHHKGKLPFTLGASFRFNGDGANLKNAFQNYYASFKSIIGVPDFYNSSYGFYFNYVGIDDTKDGNINRSYFDTIVPFYLDFDVFSNYAELHLQFETTDKNLSTEFFVYDKASFFSLIPGGESTDVWVAAGTSYFNIEEVEIPAFGSYLDRLISGQVGISNKINFKTQSLIFALNPKFYTDWLIGGNKSYELGFTVASDIGFQIHKPSSLFGFSFGLTPRIFLDIKKTKSGSSTITDFDMDTDVVWSGNFAFTFYLPRGFGLDVGLTVDSKGLPSRVAVQCTWSV